MMNCFDFCQMKARENVDLDDELVQLAQEMSEAKKNIRNLQKDRWDCCSLALDSKGKPLIKLVDEEGFGVSMGAEQDLQTKISNYSKLFGELEPIFSEAEANLSVLILRTPTVQGLRDYERELQNQKYMVNRVFKGEIDKAMQSSRVSFDDLLNNPRFQARQTEVNERIAKINRELEYLAELIPKLEKIVGSVIYLA